jgi:hypothetical protein
MPPLCRFNKDEKARLNSNEIEAGLNITLRVNGRITEFSALQEKRGALRNQDYP